MRRILPLLALCLLLAAGLPARAEDDGDPPQLGREEIRARVAAWLKELSADDFEIREAARAGLKQLGLQARDLLEGARDAEDPEVRRTVRAILEGAPAAAPAVRPGDLTGLGQVPRTVASAPLGELLGTLGERVSARFEVPAQAKDRLVSLDVPAGPFFGVLDSLLAGLDLRLAQPFDASGRATLLPVEEGFVRAPRAFAGPTQVSVAEVSATRTFGAAVPPRYAVKLRLDWVPSVQVSQYDMPNVEVARDPQGRAYRPTAAMARRVSYGVGSSSRSHVLTVHLEPGEAKAAPRLGVLEFSLALTLRHDLAVIDVDLDGPLPRTLGLDGKEVPDGTDGSVRIESIEAVDGAQGQWVVELVATLKDEVAQRTLQTWVLERDGTVGRLGVYGGRSRSADGTLRITARAYRGNRGKPAGVRVSWFRQETYGTLRYRLEDIPLR